MENKQEFGNVKFYSRKEIPLEMHKVRIVQKLNLVNVNKRLDAIEKAGYNSFLLGTTDVFLDMLTDSGTNAMSDIQLSKMFIADRRLCRIQKFQRFRGKCISSLREKTHITCSSGQGC